MTDKHRFRVVCCGRQFGKTTLAVQEMLGYAIAKAGRRVVYFATTYQQARDIAWKDILKAGEGAILDANETRLEITFKTMDEGKSVIVLRGWENVETVRGTRNHFLVLDEVSSMRRFWENWEEVLLPTLTATKGDALFLSTPKGFNHFHELFKKADADEAFSSHHYTTYDNTFLKPEDIDALKASMGEDRFAQEYMADFRKVSGLIWNLPDNQVLDASNALVARLKAYPDKMIAGLDWGFNHPTAIVVCSVKDGAFYVLDEWIESGKTTPEIIEAAKRLQKEYVIQTWYPDPARPDQIEEFKRAGMSIGETNKDVSMGLSHVEGLIRDKRLFVSSACPKLLAEMDAYAWDVSAGGKAKEAPVKENDDGCDALRYACVGHRPIDPITLRKRLMLKKAPVAPIKRYE